MHTCNWYRGFQVACQNEKCQVQNPLTLTNLTIDLSHSTAQLSTAGDKSN